MSHSLIVYPSAEADIAEAKEWYDDQRDGLETEFTDAVGLTIARARRVPFIHAPIYQDVRRAIVARFPYLVDRVFGLDIAVIAVRNGRCDPAGWQSRV
jgi:hypothetical protein